jgi:hypothetical protein
MTASSNHGGIIAQPAGGLKMGFAERLRPVAREEAHILLFEPSSTLNTGDVQDARTLSSLDWV